MNETQIQTYECRLTVHGWQLYSYDFGNEGEAKLRAQSKRRAASLSKRLTKLVNAAKAKLASNPLLDERKLAIQVRNKMHVLMNKYASSGACDTEPECVLDAELERAFGLPEYSLERM